MIRLAILLLLLAGPVAAQTNCAPHEIIADRLQSKYGEQPHGVGINASGNLIEIWVSPETGSFTALVSDPNGLSCVASAGHSWMDIEFEPPGDDM